MCINIGASNSASVRVYDQSTSVNNCIASNCTIGNGYIVACISSNVYEQSTSMITNYSVSKCTISNSYIVVCTSGSVYI